MAYKKIPLGEQLKNAYSGYRIHPEYTACAIRAFGDMPLPDYMKNSHHRTRLGMILGVSTERLEKMTVREAAVLISRKKRPGQGVLPFGELLRLLAAPMAEACRVWKEAQDAKKEEA